MAVDKGIGVDGQPFAYRGLGRPPTLVHLRLYVAHDGRAHPRGSGSSARSLDWVGLSAGTAADPDF